MRENDGRVEILELGRDDAAEPNFCGKFCSPIFCHEKL
jgi:hypothetical protein